MKDHFTPPIKSRSTNDLLEIVGAAGKWNPDAVALAKYELADRGVRSDVIEISKNIFKVKDQLEKEQMANEGYTIWDFIFRFKSTLFIIIFSWELKKDGFHRKARQQKIIRLVIIGMLILSFLLGIWN